jgi:hypothetical protein
MPTENGPIGVHTRETGFPTSAQPVPIAVYITPERHGRNFNSAEFHASPVWHCVPRPSAWMQAVTSTGCASPRHSVVAMVVVTAATPEDRSLRRGGSSWYEHDGGSPGSDGNCGGVAQLDADGDSTLIIARSTPTMGSREGGTPDVVIGVVLELVSRAWMSATGSHGSGTTVICRTSFTQDPPDLPVRTKTIVRISSISDVSHFSPAELEMSLK